MRKMYQLQAEYVYKWNVTKDFYRNVICNKAESIITDSISSDISYLRTTDQ